MPDPVSELEDAARRALVEIFEFKAFSELAYLLAIDHCKSCRGAPQRFELPFSEFDPTGRFSDRRASPAELPALLRTYEAGYLQEVALQTLVARFEYFFFDLLRLLLLNLPSRLRQDRKVDVRYVVEAASREALLSRIASEELNQLKYASPSEWFAYLDRLVHHEVAENDVAAFAELKATRDLLVHNEGIVNFVYLRKAGGLARAGEKERIQVDSQYFLSSWQLVVRLTTILSAKARSAFLPV